MVKPPSSLLALDLMSCTFNHVVQEGQTRSAPPCQAVHMCTCACTCMHAPVHAHVHMWSPWAGLLVRLHPSLFPAWDPDPSLRTGFRIHIFIIYQKSLWQSSMFLQCGIVWCGPMLPIWSPCVHVSAVYLVMERHPHPSTTTASHKEASKCQTSKC